MKKRKELLWFLIPFVLLFVIDFYQAFTDAFYNELNAYFVDWSLLGQAENGRKIFLFLLNHYVGYFLSAIVYGFVLGGVLRLVQRRVSFSRYWFYGILFTLITLGMMVYCFVQAAHPIVFTWMGLWLNAFFVANGAAFAVWLAELIWTAVKKPKQEVETP